MKVSVGSCLAIALSIGACGTAFSQEKRHDEMAGPDTKGSVEAEMRIADVNKDSKLSPAEHEAQAKQLFKAMDRDVDNRVSATEMDATQKPTQSPEGGHGHQKGESHQIPAIDKIKAMDSNRDGMLSAEESAAGAKEAFKRMDANADGFLSATEIKSGHATTTTVEETAQAR